MYKSVSTILKAAKAKCANLRSQVTEKKIKIVMGNSACDLDSAACTLVLTVFMHLQAPDSDVILLPVFNLPRKEMELKTEVRHFLDNMDVSLDDLIYRPDIGEELVLATTLRQLEVTLVDHHHDEVFQPCVVEIFDHHDVQVNIAPRIRATILPVGSCASLVIKHIQRKQAIMKSMVKYYKTLLLMCYGAILVDTVNFKKETQRASRIDEEVALALEEQLNPNGHTARGRTDFYEMVMDAKCNVAGLTPYQLLEKDYKMVDNLPLCGLSILVQEFVRRYPGAEQALRDFAASKKTPEVVLVGMDCTDGVVRRDLGFYTVPVANLVMPYERIYERLNQFLVPEFKLSLLEFPVNGFRSLKIFNQRNILLTRKHVLPSIMNCRSCLVKFPEEN